MSFYVIDVESDGPILGRNSMEMDAQTRAYRNSWFGNVHFRTANLGVSPKTFFVWLVMEGRGDS